MEKHSRKPEFPSLIAEYYIPLPNEKETAPYKISPQPFPVPRTQMGFLSYFWISFFIIFLQPFKRRVAISAVGVFPRPSLVIWDVNHKVPKYFLSGFMSGVTVFIHS